MTLHNNLYTHHHTTTSDLGTDFALTLRAESPIYAAHFPDRPITPGVCIVQTAVELLGAYLRKHCHLVRIKNAKFLSVVTPTDTPEVIFRLKKTTPNDADRTVSSQWEVRSGADVLSKLSFTCTTDE